MAELADEKVQRIIRVRLCDNYLHAPWFQAFQQFMTRSSIHGGNLIVHDLVLEGAGYKIKVQKQPEVWIWIPQVAVCYYLDATLPEEPYGFGE